MALFRYRAVDRTGNVVAGEMDSMSESAVASRLQDMGLTPLRADPAEGGSLRRLLAVELTTRSKSLSSRQLTNLTSQLATLLGAGLALEDALAMLSERERNVRVRRIIGNILQSVRSGRTLADALNDSENAFPDLYSSMVRAGESGGALNSVLDRLVTLLERTEKIRNEIRSALVYPAILMIAACASLVLVVGFVLPRFRSLFEGAGNKVPAITRFVMAAGVALEQYWWGIIVASCAIFLVSRTALRLPGVRERFDLLLLNVPVIGALIKAVQTARFTRVLGTLIGNGVPVVQALQIGADTLDNTAMRASIIRIAGAVRAGRRIADELGSHRIFPELACDLINVGEQSGQLVSMLLKSSDILDEDVRRRTQQLMTAMTPAITLLLGLFVGGVVISILLAILSINKLVM